MPISSLLSGAASGTSTATANPISATATLFQSSNINDSFAPDPNSIVPATLNQFSGIASYNYPDDFPKYYMQMGISTYNRTSTTTVASLNPMMYINLPLPMGLIDNHVVNFAQTPWPKVGNFLSGAGNQNIGDLSSSFMNKLNSALSGVTGAPGAMINAISSIPNMTPANLLQYSKYNMNEYLTVMLQSPSYKRYQFHWRFSPRTPDEALTLNKIIYLIHNSIAPGAASIAGGFLNFFTFPNVFQLAIFPNAQYMFKFKPAVVENFVVNHAPSGQPAFMRQSNQTPYYNSADTSLVSAANPVLGSTNNGGATTGLGQNAAGAGNASEGVEISMQFLELEFWLAGDFKQTNNPYDGVSAARGQSGTGAPGSGSFGSQGTG